MKNLYIIFLITIFGLETNAQSIIQGKVMEESSGEAVSYANVILNNALDSSMVKVEATEDDGSFTMANVADGKYWLSVSFVGLADYNSEVFEIKGENKDFGTLTMGVVSNEIEEVTISAARPILEVKPDKLVFNVEGSVNALGSDGLELLRKAPGVVIDNDDNIALAGKSGVRIFINNKPSPLGGEDLANFLRSLNSSDIDNIEIITNPSARFEAAGNAGIINIILKKNKNLGANATVNLGYGIGKTQSYIAGISSNYRGKKANVFGAYTYNDRERYWFMKSLREQFGSQFFLDNLSNGPRDAHNFRLGTDFFVNDKNTIGFLTTGNIGRSKNFSESTTEISLIGSETIDSILVSDTYREAKDDNYTFNINYLFQPVKDKRLNVDLDYGLFRNSGMEDQPNSYRDINDNLLSENNFANDTETNIDIYTFKLDYEQPLWGGTWGTGIKSAVVRTNNIFNFYNVENGLQTLDLERTSTFDYTENVNAIYTTFGKKITSKLNVSAGLRIENTRSTGDLTAANSTGEDDLVKRQYTDFFPSGGVTYTPNFKHSFQLNYSRRLDRPNYGNLNPFEYKINELAFRKGNPYLRPQYSNNVQLSHTYNFRLTTSFSFSHTKDLMTRISDVRGNASFLTWFNVNDQFNYSIAVSSPHTFTKWWSGFSSLTAFHLRNRAEESDEIRSIDLKVYSVNYYTSHVFTLPWDLKFEISSWGNSPGLWGGVFRTDAQFSVDLGLQKRFLNDQANIKLGVSDIFKTAPWSGQSVYGEMTNTAEGGWDTRRFKIDFTYFFGNDKVKSRRRNTGLDDEKSRAGGGGNGGGAQ